MQNFKEKFLNPDGTQLATLQTCIRTNDLSLLGDGTHLSLFHMLGNFHFGKPEDKDNYKNAIHLWDEIIREINLPVTSIHVHPMQENHKQMWENLGYSIILDQECVWTDGAIGGFCSEIYVNDLEIGNLVNTLNYSVDVGFGLERIYQILENKSRVDETSLFNQNFPPLMKDISRTLNVFWEYQINPGWKGRNQICRNLLRQILPLITEEHMCMPWYYWVETERKAIQEKIQMGKRVFYRHREKPISWFKTTYGISEDEYYLIKQEFTDENGNIIRRTKDG